MAINWSDGFRVGEGGDRNVRFEETCLNNPTITSTTRPYAELIRDVAFAHQDALNIPLPVQFILNGTLNEEEQRCEGHFTVEPSP